MHWAFDRHLIAPDTDFHWRLGPFRDPRSSDDHVLTELKGRPLFLQRAARLYPKGGDRVVEMHPAGPALKPEPTTQRVS
jgi:hypothetical protein